MSAADASAEATVRSFLAVDPGEAARAEAAACAERLRAGPGGSAVRWGRPESYHVTLRFLGDVEAARLAPLAERVAAELAESEPFELRLGAVAGFPSARRPRVVVLGLEPEAPLVELAERVERAVRAEGLSEADKPFRAHLTLGRAKGRRAPELAGAAPPEPAVFRVREVVLYASELRRGGAVHTPLHRLPLAGEPAGERVSPSNASEGDSRGEEHRA